MTKARSSLLDEIAAAVTTPARGCTVSAVIAQLDDEDRQELAQALIDDRWQSSQIARALRNRGHEISNYVVRRHRRHECGCPR